MRTLALLFLLAPAVAAQPHGAGDAHHDVIQTLVDRHDAVTRRVVDRPDGIESWTESDDPEVAALIRTHVRQMAARLAEGRPMRRWDPLFEALFEHADAIEMTMTDTERGIHVVETSADPAVVALIRQHAHRAVSEFVAEGRARYERPTPLPGEADAGDAAHPAGGHGERHGERHGPGHGAMHSTGGHAAPSDDTAMLPDPMPTLPDFADDRFATAPLFSSDAVRVVGFAFRAGQAIGAHATGADAFLLATEGRLRVVIGDAPHEIAAGTGIALPGGVPHAVEALTDARAVLVRTR